MNNEFDIETVGFSTLKNNGFDIDTMDFCDVENHVGVKSIEEINSKEEKEITSKKTEYIELDENILKEIKKEDKIIIDKIEFNSRHGEYIIFYSESGVPKEAYYDVNQSVLHKNELKKKEKLAKWGNKSKMLNNLDMNLYTILYEFDESHNSSCFKEYLNCSTNYTINYDMKDIFKNTIYNLKEKLSLLKLANKQKKHRKSKVENPKGLYIAPALASFALILGLLGINGSDTKKTATSINNTTIIANDIPEDVKVDDSLVMDKAIKNAEIAKTEKTTELDITKIEENKEEIIVVEENQTDIKDGNNIHDSFVLDDMDLEYSPVENVKHVNTSDLDYVDNYKIALLSVYDGDNVLCNKKVDNMDDKSIEELIESLNNEYGTETKKYVNWNGYDKEGNSVLEYVGWSNIENLKVKDVSYNDEQIQKLNRAKKKLLSLTNNDNSKSYQKVYTKKHAKRF